MTINHSELFADDAAVTEADLAPVAEWMAVDQSTQPQAQLPPANPVDRYDQIDPTITQELDGRQLLSILAKIQR